MAWINYGTMSLKTQKATRSLALREQSLAVANGRAFHNYYTQQCLTYCRSTLKRSEKLNYIEAVQCMGKKKARTPSAIAAGAKNRYDDFVVTHIRLTLVTHGNVCHPILTPAHPNTNFNKGNFLSWHRYFMWAWEQTLRNECGYKGYLPYYNWPQWADNPRASPLLDGSDTSISGDGVYVAGRNFSCVPNPGRCFVEVPPGMGGGCVASGPFKK
jgi:tyrosinase